MLKQIKYKKNKLNNEDGMAIIEMIPVMIVVVILLNYTLGFFGAIHTGIINNIAARNYAFETFRQRSNLVYFREDLKNTNYQKEKYRFHGIHGENSMSAESAIATTRRIAFAPEAVKLSDSGSVKVHNKDVDQITSARNDKTDVNPIWIKTAYGICINNECGDQN